VCTTLCGSGHVSWKLVFPDDANTPGVRVLDLAYPGLHIPSAFDDVDEGDALRPIPLMPAGACHAETNLEALMSDSGVFGAIRPKPAARRRPELDCTDSARAMSHVANMFPRKLAQRAIRVDGDVIDFVWGNGAAGQD
jgi:hypothetical protein